MSYVDDLNLLFEAEGDFDRRDFLKKAGGAVLSTTLPGGDLASLTVNPDEESIIGDGPTENVSGEQFPIVGRLLKNCLKDMPIIKRISSIPSSTRANMIKKHVDKNWEYYRLNDNGEGWMTPKKTNYVENLSNPVLLAFEAGLIDKEGKLGQNLGDSKFIESAFGWQHISGSNLLNNQTIRNNIDFLVSNAGGPKTFAKAFLRDWLNFSTEDQLNVGVNSLVLLSKNIPTLRDLYTAVAGKTPAEAVRQFRDMDLIDDRDISIQVHDRLEDAERKVRKQNVMAAKAAKAANLYDKASLGRWEDEGGAPGPLDEAIVKLLSIII